ncbi:hypothetical protein Nepgr_030869 [Nepenthes gracilis]|uniref:Uncharacterized protein n=1 Tax=Nepenthes gracilis TaxID=150966 RepID=A0AAD3Y704_NEPGR|nr:hypothetical protein Nepgr_030869 [Nepenthes gracilis]
MVALSLSSLTLKPLWLASLQFGAALTAVMMLSMHAFVQTMDNSWLAACYQPGLAGFSCCRNTPGYVLATLPNKGCRIMIVSIPFHQRVF